MRDYAKGYIRTQSGPGWVTVSGLDSGETYEFEISQYCGDHCPFRPGPHIYSKVLDCLIFITFGKIFKSDYKHPHLNRLEMRATSSISSEFSTFKYSYRHVSIAR